MDRTQQPLYSSDSEAHYNLAQKVLDEADSVQAALDAIKTDVNSAASSIEPAALRRTLATLGAVREKLSRALMDQE